MAAFPPVFPSNSQYAVNYVQVYEPVFHIKFQGSRRLVNMVETREFVGVSYNIPYINKLIMTPAVAFGSDIPAVAVPATEVNLTVAPFELKTYVSGFEQQALNAEAVGPQAEEHAMAIGRMQDQFIIDALNGGATNTIAANNSGLTVPKILNAQRILGLQEVPEQDRFLICHVNDYAMLLNQAQFTNRLYADQTRLAEMGKDSGYVGDFCGFSIFTLGDRPEGGLPFNPETNIRTCFAFQKRAVFLGFNLTARTNVVDVPQNFRIEILSVMTGGAVVGDASGVVAIQCDETNLFLG